MFPPVSKIDNTTVNYIPSFNKKTYPIYYASLLIVVVILVSLPLVRSTVAISARGIVRPQSERTVVKTVIGGIVDTLYYREGSSIRKGSILLRIKDPASKGKIILNKFQTNQHTQFIHDLKLLTTLRLSESLIQQLYSPLYKEQLRRYLHQKTDQDAKFKKGNQRI